MKTVKCSFLVLVACMVALACDEDPQGGDPDGTADTTSSGDTAGDVAPDTQDAADDTSNGRDFAFEVGEVSCGYGPDFVTQFDKSCVTADDCAIGVSAVDCCGTAYHAGINRSEEQRFAEWWDQCRAGLVMCGCPSMAPRAEDGNSVSEPDGIQVRCDDGACMTYVP